MVLYGAARRSRVRRIVLLAHTFGYAVFLGVVACVGMRSWYDVSCQKDASNSAHIVCGVRA